MAYLLLLIIGIIAEINSLELPKYIKKCSVKEDIGKCAIAQSEYVIKNIINGDKSLKIPSLNPFHLDEIVIDATDTLTIKINDINVYDLDSAVFKMMTNDMEKHESDMVVFFPKIHIISNYNINGRVLILPIVGNGKADIILTNTTFDFHFNWIVEDKGNEQYGKITQTRLKSKVGNMHFKLDNLFNGDKRLGDEMNIFLNENWRALSNEMEPAISRSVSGVIIQMLNAFGRMIPFSKLFDFS